MQRVPPFYLAAAALFWSWHAQVPALGVAMALLLEAPRLLRARWHFGNAEYARIADLCTWAFVILAGYLTFTRGMPLPILEIFQWLPLVWLPLIAAQLFSESGQMPLSALFLMLRPGRSGAGEDRGIDLGYPYVVVCALSAGTANMRDDSYYAGLVLLTAWALWRQRQAHYRAPMWVAMFACAAALGYAGHLGLSRLQQIVIESASGLFGGGSRVDPYQSTTDIGHIGELKQSDRIVLRVSMSPEMTVPVLLHLASYNAYGAPSWIARDAPFVAVAAEPGRSNWVIADTVPFTATGVAAPGIVVSHAIERGKAVLALPNGTLRIEQLAAQGMQKNSLGTIAIESPEDLATYRAISTPGANNRDTPREIDRRLPRQDAATLAQLAARLQLQDLPAQEAVARVKDFFAREFTYSTYRTAAQPAGTPLADFLLVTRTGHCEYFATATTLLLRAAGVPARYATGYSVQEWSAREDRYVVRERHAHAWTRAWIDGQWIDVDTTPPGWFNADAQGASRAQGLADLWSWGVYRYARWRVEEPAAYRNSALLLIALLAAILIWRLFIREPFAAARGGRVLAAAPRSQPGADSEFYRIEAWLARAGAARAPHESLSAWLMRTGNERADINVAALQELLALHYRYRFDPNGLSAPERSALADQAQRWLRAQQNPR